MNELTGIVLLLIIILPLIFYFGSHIKTRKQYQKKQKADALLYEKVLANLNQHLGLDAGIQKYNVTHDSLISFIHRETRFPLTQNTRFKLLLDGEQTFDTLFHEIQKAKHHVHIAFYIVQDDEVGKKLQKILIKKAQEGVQVRLLVDGVGSRAFDQKAVARLERYGIRCSVFSPPKLSFVMYLNFRNHRKIVVIDGKVGLIGGINIGNEYIHQDPKIGYWRDIHSLVEGESVLLLQRIFATDWYYVKGEKMDEEGLYFPTPSLSADDLALIQVVPSGPDMKKHVIKNVYRHMILSAKERLFIGTPYFVPDQQIMDAFLQALQNGVKVTIIVPEKTDNFLVQHASYHYFEKLIKAGASIRRFTKGFYHAKVALVDQDVAKIGSANFDQRSFYSSFEAGIFVYHQPTCLNLKKVFESDLKETVPLTLEEIQNRSFWQKAGTRFSLLFAPLL